MKKYFHYVILVFIVIIIFYIYIQNQPENTTENKTLNIQELSLQDSDGDGIPDWKENLLGETTKEDQYIQTPLSPRDVTVNTNTQESLSNFFDDLKTLNENGTITQESVDIVTNDFFDSIDNPEDLVKDLKIPEFTNIKTKEVYEKFLEDFYSAFDPLIGLKSNELQILKSVLDREEGSREKLQQLIILYKQVYNNFGNIVVPIVVANDYIDLYIRFSIYYRAFELFFTVEDIQSYLLIYKVIDDTIQRDENGSTAIDRLAISIVETLQKN